MKNVTDILSAYGLLWTDIDCPAADRIAAGNNMLCAEQVVKKYKGKKFMIDTATGKIIRVCTIYNREENFDSIIQLWSEQYGVCFTAEAGEKLRNLLIRGDHI